MKEKTKLTLAFMVGGIFGSVMTAMNYFILNWLLR